MTSEDKPKSEPTIIPELSTINEKVSPMMKTETSVPLKKVELPASSIEKGSKTILAPMLLQDMGDKELNVPKHKPELWEKSPLIKESQLRKMSSDEATKLQTSKLLSGFETPLSSAEMEMQSMENVWPPRPAHVRATGKMAHLLKRKERIDTYKEGREVHFHDGGRDITTPKLTTPIKRKEFKRMKDRTLISTESTTDTDREVKPSVYSPRPERYQPYPPDRAVLDALGMTDDRFDNRIVLRRSAVDGGIVFLVPAIINDFLGLLFRKYTNKETGEMEEKGFESLLLDAGLLNIAATKIKHTQTAPRLSPESRSKRPVLRNPKGSKSSTTEWPNSNIKASKMRNRDIWTADDLHLIMQGKKPALPKIQISSRMKKPKKVEPPQVQREREEKIIRCVFRYRENPTGEPICFAQFLRVLHRLARYKYRRNHIRDDEAVNAMVVYLARSNAAPKGRFYAEGKPETGDANIQAVLLETTDATQTDPLLLTTTATMTDPYTLPQPKTLIVKVPEQKIVYKEVEKPSEPKIIYKEIEKPKRVLARTNILIAEQLKSDKKKAEKEEKMSKEQTGSEVEMSREMELLEKSCYQLFRLYCDFNRGQIPMMTLDALEYLLEDSGLIDEVEPEDISDFYDLLIDERGDDIDAIDFIDFQTIVFEFAEIMYGEDEDTEQEQTLEHLVIRNYFVPLLHELQNRPEIGFPFHIVNSRGDIVDQNGFVIPGLRLTENGEVVDLFSRRTLPGDVYDQNEMVVRSFLPPPLEFMRESTQIGGGLPEETIHPRISSIGATSPDNVMANLPPEEGVGRLRTQFIDYPSLLQTSGALQQLPGMQAMPKFVSIETGQRVTETLHKTSLGLPLARKESTSDEISHRYTTNITVVPQKQMQQTRQMVPDGHPRNVIRNLPRNIIYQLSNYEIDPQTGNVRTSDEKLKISGFTAGPNDTVVGPDGRPLFGAKVRNDGKIEIEKELLDERTIASPFQVQENHSASYLKSFPVAYSESSESESDSEFYGNIADSYEALPPLKQLKRRTRDKDEHDIALAGADPRLVLNRFRKDEGVLLPLAERRKLHETQDAAIEGWVYPIERSKATAGFITPRFAQ